MAYMGPPPATMPEQVPKVTDSKKFLPKSARNMLILSITQVSMGSLCVILAIILLVLQIDSYYYAGSDLADFGYGIWIGLVFVLVGGMGIGAAKRNSRCLITASLVLNIISSSLWCLALLGFSIAALIGTVDNECFDGHDDYPHCGGVISNSFYALNSLMLILAVAELVVTIWSAALCCGAVCNCCKSQQRMGPYRRLGEPSQEVLIVPGPAVPYYGSVSGQHPAYYQGVYQPVAGYMPPPSHAAGYMPAHYQPGVHIRAPDTAPPTGQLPPQGHDLYSTPKGAPPNYSSTQDAADSLSGPNQGAEQ